jgi:hypothetical protein
MTAIPDETVEVFRGVFESLLPHLNERQRRLAAGAVARALGHGGMVAVVRASGLSQATVSSGLWELEAGADRLDGRIRQAGAGRKSVEVADPQLVPALLALVEPTRRGDPMSALSWTTLSTRDLAQELSAAGHRVSHSVVGRLLREQGFVLRGNAKVLEGTRHSDRDAQFRHINDTVEAFLAAGDPVASIDAKKKEMIGNFANPGRTWHPAQAPVKVRDHDFPDPGAGVAIPFGIYDIAANTGWVNVGIDHGTAAFAVESVRRWWYGAGQARYPDSRRLLLTCDAGGSNAANSRLFKAELAALACQIGLEITVCHFPPGTSRWNKIEHRLFSAITHNWRGQPLTSLQVVLDTIAATTTSTGLKVHAELDTAVYPTGREISKAHFDSLPIDRHHWHGDWNYTARPEPPTPTAPPGPAVPVLPRPDTSWLGHPAVATVLDPDYDRLLAHLQPVRAPGYRHRQPRGQTTRLSTAEKLQITLLHRRHRLPQTDIGTLFGITRYTVGTTSKDTATRLASQGHPLTPAAEPLRTLTALATTTGIPINTTHTNAKYAKKIRTAC